MPYLWAALFASHSACDAEVTTSRPCGRASQKLKAVSVFPLPAAPSIRRSGPMFFAIFDGNRGVSYLWQFRMLRRHERVINM